MEENKERELRASHLAFIGRVLATFNHELKNHLAIINESAGLILDLMALDRSSSGKHADQYVKSLRLIQSQIEKTLTLTMYFNRFSQRMDNPLSTFDVNDVVEELLVLVHRFANQRRITIEKSLRRDIKPIFSDPARLQFVVFCLMEENMGRLAENSSIEFRTTLSDDAVLISVIPKGGGASRGEERGFCPQELLKGIIGELGGTISWKGEKATVSLPLRAAGVPDS